MHTSQTEFIELLVDYYARSARESLPWRSPDIQGRFDPYSIMVSELMLQQTQVQRVIPKYEQFLKTYPTVASLASAPLGDVLQQWQGLGYNRRAKFLWQAAQLVHDTFDDCMPNTVEQLVTLPGIGINTAGAIAVYAWNIPIIFIETNVRTVYINHFFSGVETVADSELRPVIAESLDTIADFGFEPRQFYWALMDYGTYLKKTIGNVSKRSKHYVKQLKFEGSERQIRGIVIRALSSSPNTKNELEALVSDQRLQSVLDALVREGLIAQVHEYYRLP